MVSVAAGLAKIGMRPWVYSIAPFLYARAFEHILRAQFGQGFAPLEADSVHRWYWSNGLSGEGAITIWNRLQRPVEGIFQACITTGYMAPAKLELVFRGEPEFVPLDAGRCPLRRRWRFEPGKNEILIHSYEHRVRAPNDSRYIIFGVYDWKLTPVE
jgi:hypothetical protein